MEEEHIGEQPQSVEPSLEENEAGSPQQEVEEEGATSEAEKGGPLGKFKSVDDLYDAYNNLQAEFTRKSQKLSQLEKDKANKETDLFEEGFNSFLSKHDEATPYAEEIRQRVEQDESLKKDVAGFDKAWAELLYEKLTSSTKAKEPIVQNLILNDNELQRMVVENYMKQLSLQGSPIVISSKGGERVTKPEIKKPDTFEEAKKVVLNLLD